MTKVFLPVVAVLVVALTGCTTRIGDFNAISTKNIYCTGTDITELPKKHGVEGKDLRFLGIGANIQDAVDRALEQGDGNLMVDAALYMESWPFVAGYKVRGTVVKVPYRTAEASTQ